MFKSVTIAGFYLPRITSDTSSSTFIQDTRFVSFLADVKGSARGSDIFFFFLESVLCPAVSSYLVQGQEAAGFCSFIPVIRRE